MGRYDHDSDRPCALCLAHIPVTHLCHIWAFTTLGFPNPQTPVVPVPSPLSKQLLSILHTQPATPAVPPCCSLWKSQPNKFYTSIISGVINLPLETSLKCWRYWLGRVISFVFTGALVFFLLNKKCPKWSAFCIYSKNYLFSSSSPPSLSRRTRIASNLTNTHREGQHQCQFARPYWCHCCHHSGTRGDLSPKTRSSTNTHLLLPCNIGS